MQDSGKCLLQQPEGLDPCFLMSLVINIFCRTTPSSSSLSRSASSPLATWTMGTAGTLRGWWRWRLSVRIRSWMQRRRLRGDCLVLKTTLKTIEVPSRLYKSTKLLIAQVALTKVWPHLREMLHKSVSRTVAEHLHNLSPLSLHSMMAGALVVWAQAAWSPSRAAGWIKRLSMT